MPGVKEGGEAGSLGGKREVDCAERHHVSPTLIPSAFWLGHEGGGHMSDTLILAL